ncbi:MAG: bifunctional tetrahydrofolate synthase/dihydrofolate synthase [Polaromonas sp.]|nr:bifunctional tetrahydrofolate synthase/dihydrofolate synthase [Polaromonas sp.]MBP6088831.1 bifunctional tetrahydrofolate synthase/dihydrofolate synthase [Polaromonas sp.]MBP6141826.1 bifunctional tetrahydrofolate synthase/dihydrofolate synthase [Polaromonas sp.]MBP6156330.1 bifunctional tetrahydrofolate synthase/dihydrofolate synthase [Polaromonas sp.]MBP7115256.1 bifunctional tetrahydrofolate synthase/dihydrofolate synthase [Polaromonas sp.]
MTEITPLTTPNNSSSLQQWLNYCEQLHDKSIDMGLSRVREVAQRMGLHFKCPVITVAGTNGKGSTCALTESILSQAGYKTGVFTSPHLVHFEERLRIGGVAVDPKSLVTGFLAVEAARVSDSSGDFDDVSLTYFEFTTLAILHVMTESKLDIAILEVGLGGRLDAVNIIDADCAIITSIDLDHMEYLGDSREKIGFEKAGVMRTGAIAVVSDPVPPTSVVTYANAIGTDLWLVGRDFSVEGDKLQWSWSGRGKRYAGLAYPALRGANQLINAAGVLAALTALRDRLPITAQAVRNGLAFVELPGRFQIIPGEPTLVLDVAHNPHAIATLALNLDAMGYSPCTHAVFGAMADKNIPQMIARMNPLVDKWYFTDLPTTRAATAAQLLEFWQAIDNGRRERYGSRFETPAQALRAAISDAQPTDRIVVFGSFYTVGGVLENGVPKLTAQHLT